MSDSNYLFDLDVPGNDLHPVRPVRPVAPYLGGKRALAQQLVAMIGDIPHTAYVEVFMGMGGVFFRRTLRPSCEVINDWSADVAGLFRILQRHYQPFLDMIRWRLATRDDWDKLMRTDPDTLTDLERAARFLYLQRLAFGGKVTKRNFGMIMDGPSRFDVTRLPALLEDVHARLAGVVIERLPWAELIARYDRPEALFYLDPPYFGCETDYGEGMFGREEFAQIADRLRQLRGRFILSINDAPEIREIFDRFERHEVQISYTVSGEPTAAAELIYVGR